MMMLAGQQLLYKSHIKRTAGIIGMWDVITRSVHRNYYDALGLSSKASQADIKKAYYKLSLKHHPDMSKGESETFREITAAYEVLGNLKLRKLYDRGILPGVDVPIDDSSDPKTPYHPDYYTQKARKAPTTGRTRSYDYDEWSRAHYGNMVQDMANRREKRAKAEANESKHSGQHGIELLFIALCTGIALTTFMGSLSFPDYSNPSQTPKSRRSPGS